MFKRQQYNVVLYILCLVINCRISIHGQSSAPEKDNSLKAVQSLLDRKQFKEAEQSLRAYIEKYPTSAQGHFLLGYALFREERPKDSLAEFTEGAKYQRPGTSDLKIVAADYVVLGDFTDADKWLTFVIKESPEDAEAWYLLGRTKYNENRFQEAVQCFQRNITIRPNDVKAQNNLGLAYQGLNRNDEAKAAYESAIVMQKDSLVKDAQPYLNLGSLLADQDQPERALEKLQKAASLAPHNPKVHEQLGRVYDLLEMRDKAEQELEQAVALAPNVPGLHYRLGQIYRHEGKKQQAQQQFDICAKLNSSHSSIETPNPAEQN